MEKCLPIYLEEYYQEWNQWWLKHKRHHPLVINSRLCPSSQLRRFIKNYSIYVTALSEEENHHVSQLFSLWSPVTLRYHLIQCSSQSICTGWSYALQSLPLEDGIAHLNVYHYNFSLIKISFLAKIIEFRRPYISGGVLTLGLWCKFVTWTLAIGMASRRAK